MFAPASALTLDEGQRKRLLWLVKSGDTPQKLAKKCRAILLAADGLANREIARQIGCSRPAVIAWRKEFQKGGVPTLSRKPRRRRRKRGLKLTPEGEAELVRATLETKPADATHWSVRSFARAHGLSPMTVHRLWRRYELQPHRVESFKISNDTQFDAKVRDVVGLYLDPPERAVVLCVDEKSQIQALDRTAPLLPLRPGQAERRTHDYKRHGTTTLFAAFNILDGKVIGQCLPRHRQREFLKFLNSVERQLPQDLDIHLILDNYSTHKGTGVQSWLKRKKSRARFRLHFIPTSSSWLNLVERWFAEITRKRIRRGVFRSVQELERAIYQYLVEYDKSPKPFKWVAIAEAIIAKVDYCKKLRDTGH